uniref:EAL domain-containing protein n=1 Tax=Sphaerothrix gracilis TaxID=3151835 RepID=UPI0031FD817E
VCYQLRAWQIHFNLPNLRANINLSNIQFEREDMVDKIVQIFDSTGISPQSLRFELTESMLMKNSSPIVTAMQQLRQFGVQFHLDDFGQGYSSLSVLHKLPIDALKIDYTFIKKITTDKSSLAIVKTIMALANSLNISCVAEGIETQDQLQQLTALGCELGQGYFFSKPLMASAVESFLPGKA